MAKITQQSIDDLTDKLKKEPDLPAAEREFTKKEAVVALRPTIEDLRKRGFTLEQVAALLRIGHHLRLPSSVPCRPTGWRS